MPCIKKQQVFIGIIGTRISFKNYIIAKKNCLLAYRINQLSHTPNKHSLSIVQVAKSIIRVLQ